MSRFQRTQAITTNTCTNQHTMLLYRLFWFVFRRIGLCFCFLALWLVLLVLFRWFLHQPHGWRWRWFLLFSSFQHRCITLSIQFTLFSLFTSSLIAYVDEFVHQFVVTGPSRFDKLGDDNRITHPCSLLECVHCFDYRSCG